MKISLKNKIWLLFFCSTAILLLLIFSSTAFLYHQGWINNEKNELVQDLEMILEPEDLVIDTEFKKDDYYLAIPEKKYFSVTAQKHTLPRKSSELHRIGEQTFLIEIFNTEKYGTIFFGKDVTKYLKAEDAILLLFSKISLLLFFIVTCIAWIFSRLVIQPIKTFQQSLEKISAQSPEWKGETSFNKNDEFELLQESFYEMLKKISYFQQQQKDFIAHASHELRTPLMSMSSALDLAKKHPEKITEAKEDLQFLAKLVDQLLLLTRVENVEYQKEKINITELLEATQKKYKAQFDEKNIKIELVLQTKILKTNKELFTRVIENLFENALKFTSKNGVFHVHINKNTILFKNTFKGNYDAKKLTEAFYQADISKSNNGAGLGLYFVKKVIQRLGYTFEIHIKNDEFLFTLSF